MHNAGEVQCLNLQLRIYNVRAATVLCITSTLSIKSNQSLHLQLSWYSVQCPCSHILVVQVPVALQEHKVE